MTHIKLSEKGDTIYILSGISEALFKLLKEGHNKKDFSEFNKKSDIITEGIIKAGAKEKAKARHISSYVSYLKGYHPRGSINNYNRRVQFRDYTRTEEQQLKNAHLVAVCSDSTSSAKTAIKSIKENYLVLWKKPK